MIKKKIIQTIQAPKPLGPYSQAVQVGNLLFCSGQIAIDPTDNQVKLGSVAEQAKLVLENIKGVLTAAGANFDHVVKSTMFLKSMSDFGTVNEIYGQYFIHEPPARTTIAVAELPKGVSVEIEVIAAL